MTVQCRKCGELLIMPAHMAGEVSRLQKQAPALQFNTASLLAMLPLLIGHTQMRHDDGGTALLELQLLLFKVQAVVMGLEYQSSDGVLESAVEVFRGELIKMFQSAAAADRLIEPAAGDTPRVV